MEICLAGLEELAVNNEALETTTLQELSKTREEIKKARESNVAQSWLDSKPIVDKLEKLRSALSKTKDRLTMTSTVTASLESQLESTSKSIGTEIDEEGKSRLAIREMYEDLDRNRKELEILKVEISEENKSQAKLKEESRLKRRSLRTLQLTQRAISMEIEALNASVNATIHQVKLLKMDHNMVALSQEEYQALNKKANEETALANWRITALEEQRHEAEVSKANALRRLEALHMDKQLKEDGMQGVWSAEAHEMADNEAIMKSRSKGAAGKITKPKDSPLPHQELEDTERNSRHPKRRLRGGSDRKMARKKRSILQKIRIFFVQKIMGFFV